MSDRYAGSFFLSLLLHIALAVILFVVAYVLHPREPEETQIFEVVAGPGNDAMATEAPSAPTQEFTMDLPEPLPDIPVVEPVPVEIEPVVPEVIQPPTPTPTPPKEKPKPKPPTPVTPVTPPTPPKVQPKPRTTMTKEEFDRQFAQQKNASQKSSPAPPKVAPKLIDPNAVTNGLKSTSPGAGGTALTAQVKNQMDAYFSRLLALLKKNHQTPPGVSDQLEVLVSYHVSAAGKVSQARIIRSSGNAAFDQSVLAAFAALPIMGARPDGLSGSQELAFRLRDLR